MTPELSALGGAHLAAAPFTAQTVADVLIAALWQSALLAALVTLFLKLLPRTTAAARFAIWTVAFCVSMVMPFAAIRSAATAVTPYPATAEYLRFDPRWSYLVVGVWSIAALVRLAQFAIQGVKLRVLWRGAVPVSEESLAVLGCSDLSSTMQEGRRVRVCISDEVDRPSVIGFFAPRILLPTWLLERLSSLQLRHIVLHEMEHLRRRDDWFNLMQKVGLVIFPLSPALLWVDRRLSSERELACDEGVLRKIAMPRAYAASLTSIAEMRMERRTHGRVFALALGILGAARILRNRSEFGRRIETILDNRRSANPVLAGIVAAILAVSVIGAGLGLAHMSRLVSFELPSISPGVAASKSQENASATLSVRLGAQTGDRPPYAQRVGFHLSAAGQRVAAKASNRAAFRTASVHAVGRTIPSAPHGKAQWLVLTDQSTGSRRKDTFGPVVEPLLVRLSDGRFYATPYAAVPVQDGWLIVQL